MYFPYNYSGTRSQRFRSRSPSPWAPRFGLSPACTLDAPCLTSQLRRHPSPVLCLVVFGHFSLHSVGAVVNPLLRLWLSDRARALPRPASDGGLYTGSGAADKACATRSASWWPCCRFRIYLCRPSFGGCAAPSPPSRRHWPSPRPAVSDGADSTLPARPSTLPRAVPNGVGGAPPAGHPLGPSRHGDPAGKGPVGD